MPLHQEKGERLDVWQLISLRECFYQHRHFQEVSFSPRCSFLGITPAFAAGLERSGKPVRQHALVRLYFSTEKLLRFYIDVSKHQNNWGDKVEAMLKEAR